MVESIHNDLTFGFFSSRGFVECLECRPNSFKGSSHGTHNNANRMRRLIEQVGNKKNGQVLGLRFSLFTQTGISLSAVVHIRIPPIFVKVWCPSAVQSTSVTIHLIVLTLSMTNQSNRDAWTHRAYQYNYVSREDQNKKEQPKFLLMSTDITEHEMHRKNMFMVSPSVPFFFLSVIAFKDVVFQTVALH